MALTMTLLIFFSSWKRSLFLTSVAYTQVQVILDNGTKHYEP